jgi:MFS family permease
VRFPEQHPVLGLGANWRQFSLLVLVNAFVGAMVGMERIVLPLLAEREFSIASNSVIFSFLVSFGVVKALANLVAGHAGDRFGRRRVLILGWLLGLPVPALIYWAPSWNWVVGANVLLGINQGLCWSTTVIMKIDLAGPERRGLAMGLNEAAGYVAVALAAFASGYVATAHGLRAAPLWVGGSAAVMGLVVSCFLVRESSVYAEHESRMHSPKGVPPFRFRQVFWITSWGNRSLFAICQTGLANNLNDGMAWGLLPLYLSSQGLPLAEVGTLGALYPAVWGLFQLATGWLSDRIGRKRLIVGGMLLQAGAIASFVMTRGFSRWAAAVVVLGLGTAMVYPTLLAAVGDIAHPSWRATSVGVYRLWRDAGYAFGAVIAGVVSDLLGMLWAFSIVAAVTAISGLVTAAALDETLKD